MPQLLPGQKLLSTLRYEIRSKADMLILGAPLNGYPDPYASSFYNTTELNLAVNNSCREFADVLATEYGNYYDTATAAFLTDGVNEQFPLPLDHLKLLGVEWQMSPPSNNQNIALKRFMIGERDKYSFGYLAASLPYPGVINVYSEFGNNIWIKPLPAAGMSFQLLYVPLPPVLADVGTVTLNGTLLGDNVTINGITFTSHFLTTRTNGMVLSFQTYIGVPQTSNPTVINYWTASTGTAAGSLPAGLAASPPSTGTVNDGSINWQYCYPSQLTWTPSFGPLGHQWIIAIPQTGNPTVLNYWTASAGTTGTTMPSGLAQPNPPSSVTDGTVTWVPVNLPFFQGASDALTAPTLTWAISQSPLGGTAGFLTANTNGIQTVLNLQGPSTIVWSTHTTGGNTHMVLYPSQVSGPTGWGLNGTGTPGVGSPFITWTNIFQEYSGWSEYVITDCAIKLLQKEESYEAVQVLAAAKQFQLGRLQKAANNRDAANPHRITDATSAMWYGSNGRRRGRGGC